MTVITKKANQMSKIFIAEKGFPHEEMVDQLQEFIGDLPYKGKETFLNTPVRIGTKSIEDYNLLSKLFYQVFSSIAINYVRDERLHHIYQLDDFLISVLNTANTVHYYPKFYRPDFIYDTTGQEKICEIGCRYPINGWMFSHYLNEISEKLSNTTNSNWNAVEGQADFLSEFEKEYNIEEPIFLIHKKEKGTEVNYLIKELADKGIRIISITPEELKIKEDGTLTAKGEIASQFFLELDREELRLFNPMVLREVITKGKCINDVRNIILIHDKRIMALLFNEVIMVSYASGPDYEFLKKFLIPSFTLNDPIDRDFLINDTQNWILKPNSGGRGIDIYIKDECDPETWKNVITNEWKNYMVQGYVEQQKFTIGSEKEQREVNLVGMVLMHNDKSFGPGLFRGSSDSIINLHEGRGVVLPCVIDKTIE